jgi:hypothetical protein
MAAAAVQIAAAAIPFLFSLFGRGKNPETQKAEAMPDEFMRVMQQMLGDANMDRQRAVSLWDNYVQRIQDMADQGYGTPEQIMGQGASVVRDEGQGAKRTQETTELDERFRNGPNAETTWGDVSSILDQMGIGAGATFDAVEGLIRDSNGRVLGTINDVEKKILEMTGSTFDAAGAIHQKLYGELRGRMGAGFKEQRGQLGKFETDATRALEGEYKVDANAALDKAFSPDATSARTGRAFAPAAAAAAFRSRRAGLADTDPTAGAMQSRVEASRSRAVDDALSLDAEKLANARLGVSGRVLDTRLGIGGKVLDTGLGISRDEMGRDVSLSTADEAIQRGLILDRGAIDRGTVDTAGQRRIAEDVRSTNLNIANTNRYQDQANQVYAGRIAAATDKLVNSRGDLAIAAGLADRRNDDREYQNRLRQQQFNVGMQFANADYGRKDRGTTAIGTSAENAFNRQYRSTMGAGQFGQQASRGYDANAERANAKSGGFAGLLSDLAGTVGGAASDYFKNRSKGGANTYNPPGWNAGTGTWE